MPLRAATLTVAPLNRLKVFSAPPHAVATAKITIRQVAAISRRDPDGCRRSTHHDDIRTAAMRPTRPPRDVVITIDSAITAIPKAVRIVSLAREEENQRIRVRQSVVPTAIATPLENHPMASDTAITIQPAK